MKNNRDFRVMRLNHAFLRLRADRLLCLIADLCRWNVPGMFQDTTRFLTRVLSPSIKSTTHRPHKLQLCLRVKGTTCLKIGVASGKGKVEAREQPYFRYAHAAIAGNVDLEREAVHMILGRGRTRKSFCRDESKFLFFCVIDWQNDTSLVNR